MKTIWWEAESVKLIDQTLLPEKLEIKTCTTIEEVWEAIKTLRVRGAPAIGIAAALGIALGLRKYTKLSTEEQKSFWSELDRISNYFASSRPTAVNLFWAINRMREVAGKNMNQSPPEIANKLLTEAINMIEEDDRICRAIGKKGAELIQDGDIILTHCNAGGLATASYGTALAIMFYAKEQGKGMVVYADETRPLLQGSRLTAWELMQAGIEVYVICDNMAALVMREKGVNKIIVGADRIAANGDTANKIGTYGLACLAKVHNIPFYIAAPLSTIDRSIPNGLHIPIEERKEEEITCGFGKQTAPKGVKVFNPAFDVTPAELITAIITEKGLARPPYEKSLANLT